MNDTLERRLTCALTEAWGDVVDRSEPYFDDIANAYQRNNGPSLRRDRSDGRFLPVYDNEIDLAIIRGMSRLLHERVPMAKAKTRRLQDYTISRGFDWSVTHDSPAVEALANRILESFAEDNDWTVNGERDSYEAECVDGEFVADLAVVDGQIEMRWLTSDNLVEPIDPRQLEEWKELDFPCSWLFGVATRQYSPHKPLYYHVVRDEGGTDWDLIPSRHMIHWRRNVPMYAKRGYSDHYTTHVYLGRADKVLSNTAEGAAIQAAIAYIVEHAPGVTSRSASNVVSGLLNTTGRDINGVMQRKKKIVPGQRLDIPQGMKYHAGLFGSSNNDIYISVMESLVRLSGTVEAFPEHMLTGFAGNNNMASSLTAESPFIQGRLVDQEVRKMRKIRLLKQVLGLAHEAGMFGRFLTREELFLGLEVTVSPAEIVTRDPLALTQALSAQKAEGWVSDRTASQELGRDYEAEQENIKSEPKKDSGAPGGAPPPIGMEEDVGVGVGGMASLSRMQFKRNRAAILDILSDLDSESISLRHAKTMLRALGLTDAEAEGLLADYGGEEDSLGESVDPLKYAEGLFRY